MTTRPEGRRGKLGGWRLFAAALLLPFAGASCTDAPVTEPPPSGAVWTRLTPTSSDDCFFPDVLYDSLVYSVSAFVPVAPGTFGYRQRIAVSGIDGKNPVRILYGGNADWNDVFPRWSGRQQIVFSGNRNPNDLEMWHKDLDTFSESRVAPAPTNDASPAPRPGTNGLAYIELPSSALTIFDFGRVVLIPDTTAHPPERIYLTPDTLLCADPDWDPSGATLTFSVKNRIDLTNHIYTLHLAPGDTIPVPTTTGACHDRFPRWSPDGGRIAFTSDRTGRSGLWVVNPLGEAKGLTLVGFEDKGASVYTPAWLSDGTGIIVSSNGRGGIRSLWLVSNLPVFGY